MSYRHPSAIVDEGVSIGRGTKVWHFTHLCEGAVIGDDCTLGQNVFIGRSVRVGSRVKIQNNVSIYEGVEIEDDVFLGPSCVFTNVRNPRSEVDRRAEFQPTRVARGVTVGANATIVCGSALGAYSFIGAGAVVTRDVAPHALMAGNPARRIGWVSRAGERLASGPVARCPREGDAYRISAETCVPIDESEAAQLDSREPIALLDLVAQHRPLESQLRGVFERVLSSGHFILGDEVSAFERECAEWLGVSHAIGVSSGTDALLLSLMALEIGPGDEVITTPFSFFATVATIIRVGAKPVFVDIDAPTLNLDPGGIVAAITPRTKAILPVHIFGRPASMDSIGAIAKEHGLFVIEDAAQAFGARTGAGRVGTLGTIGAFSFFPSKNLGALGDAGLVVTGDDALADRVRLLRHQGMRPKYVHSAIGGNFRIDALQAALLRAKLPHTDGWAAARRANARFYDDALSGLDAIEPPDTSHPGHVWNQYTIRCAKRGALKAHLSDAHIASEIYYPLGLHRQPALSRSSVPLCSMPRAERACDEVLSLPIHPELGEARLARIVAQIESFCRLRQ